VERRQDLTLWETTARRQDEGMSGSGAVSIFRLLTHPASLPLWGHGKESSRERPKEQAKGKAKGTL